MGTSDRTTAGHGTSIQTTNRIRCPHCGYENPTSAEFCGMCAGLFAPAIEVEDVPPPAPVQVTTHSASPSQPVNVNVSVNLNTMHMPGSAIPLCHVCRAGVLDYAYVSSFAPGVQVLGALAFVAGIGLLVTTGPDHPWGCTAAGFLVVLGLGMCATRRVVRCTNCRTIVANA